MAPNDLPSLLHYTNDSNPGFHHKTAGKIQLYLDDNGMEVKSKNLMKRINDVIIAAVLCSFIGGEREKSDKPAGLRTNMIMGSIAGF